MVLKLRVSLFIGSRTYLNIWVWDDFIIKMGVWEVGPDTLNPKTTFV
jgi:hypothetical protein